MKVCIEATELADADALRIRLIEFLKKLDKGDYSGRLVWLESGNHISNDHIFCLGCGTEHGFDMIRRRVDCPRESH